MNSINETAIMICFAAGCCNVTLTNRNKLVSLIVVVGKMIGMSQAKLDDLYNREVLRKASSLLESLEFVLLP